MIWCNGLNNPMNINSRNTSNSIRLGGIYSKINLMHTHICPSCGHHMSVSDQGSGINYLPGLPAGVKFDPTDSEILGHLEAKVKSDLSKLHPLLHEFIPTIEGENGICYTHPDKLPGVTKDGVMRHFFHCPSKAYTTGTRKRRKVHTYQEDGGETRWHKTGKTRPILVNGVIKGFKKILVLYTNYGRQKKPEKTNWVMHQYHLGQNEEEKEGEFVLSKVFYQTQPRQCGTNFKEVSQDNEHPTPSIVVKAPLNYYHPTFISYDHHQHSVIGEQNRESPPHLNPNLVLQADHVSSLFLAPPSRKS